MAKMPANLSCWQCCGLCALYTSSGEVEEVVEVVKDPEIEAEYRLPFLGYPEVSQIHWPGDLSPITRPKVRINYGTTDLSREEWNAEFRSLVDCNVVTEIRLRIFSMEVDQAPDFSILFQPPIRSVSIENYMAGRAIPQNIITALEAHRGLEALTFFDERTRPINLPPGECFPNLRYLHVRLDNDVDFSKLQRLTVLKVVLLSNAHKIVDLSSLTRLSALEVSSNRAVLKLVEDHSLLKWLHLQGGIEVSGDLSTVTHLLLGGEAKDDIVGRCQNLKQLSLYETSYSSIEIPASVDRLFILRCKLKEVQLASELELDVLSLTGVQCPQFPKKLRARHLSFRFDYVNKPADLQKALRETDLGSPESLSVENSEDASVAFMEFLLKKEEFRRHIRFLATDVPLKQPLPAMRELREICLGRFADVEQIREIGKLRPLESLFIAAQDIPAFSKWGELRLQDISKRLNVPEEIKIPEDLGLPVLKATASFLRGGRYARNLWVDYVKRSSGVELDVQYAFL